VARTLEDPTASRTIDVDCGSCHAVSQGLAASAQPLAQTFTPPTSVTATVAHRPGSEGQFRAFGYLDLGEPAIIDRTVFESTLAAQAFSEP
jgi:hypothetical protein